MAKVHRLRATLRAMEKLERESMRKNNGSVVVGYAASYAVHVHEDLEAKHGAEYNAAYGREFGKRDKKGRFLKGTGGKHSRGPDQQAKFLEKPAREMQDEIARTITQGVKNGLGLVKAQVVAGLLLQRASQKIVPVDLGNLRGSAFTEEE